MTSFALLQTAVSALLSAYQKLNCPLSTKNLRTLILLPIKILYLYKTPYGTKFSSKILPKQEFLYGNWQAKIFR